MESSRRYPPPPPPPPPPLRNLSAFLDVYITKTTYATRSIPTAGVGWISIFWRSDRNRRDRSYRSFHSLGHTRSRGAATRDASWIFICQCRPSKRGNQRSRGKRRNEFPETSGEKAANDARQSGRTTLVDQTRKNSIIRTFRI